MFESRLNWFAAAIGGLLLAQGCGVMDPGAARDRESGLGSQSAAVVADGQGYFTAERDARRCAWPRCGGYFVKRVNESLTRCADGTLKPSCYVVAITQTEEVANGAVIRGVLRTEVFGSFGVFGLLEVQESWTPFSVDTAPTAGKFYQVFDSGIRCIRAPCFSLTAALLNAPGQVVLSGLTGKLAEKAYEGLRTGKIVVNGLLQGRDAKRLLRVQQLYLPGASAPSGRLCAEYTTSDGRFYAKNFLAAQQAEAEEWIRLDPQVTAAGIGATPCAQANAKTCPAEDPSVCGIPVKTDTPEDFASLCEFRKVIREAAGIDGESKGRFTDGICPEVCALAILDAPPTNSPTVYTKNFLNREQAEQWLSNTFPEATSRELEDGNCAAQPDCFVELYAPVCGTIRDEAPHTYQAPCHFLAEVMHDAGKTGESKGYYSFGRCALWD